MGYEVVVIFGLETTNQYLESISVNDDVYKDNSIFGVFAIPICPLFALIPDD